MQVLRSNFLTHERSPRIRRARARRRDVPEVVEPAAAASVDESRVVTGSNKVVPGWVEIGSFAPFALLSRTWHRSLLRRSGTDAVLLARSRRAASSPTIAGSDLNQRFAINFRRFARTDPTQRRGIEHPLRGPQTSPR